MQTERRRPITRNRELLACSECRRRKLRCDRNTPCGNCRRRDDDDSCVYERNARGAGSERERRIQAESRLEHLEGLVQQLAGQQAPSSHGSGTETGALSSAPKQPASDIGSLGQTRNWESTEYSGSTHWSAMLKDIEELRYALEPADVTESEISNIEDDSSSYIFGAGVPLSLDQLLKKYLPPRLDADRLVASYFRATALAAPFIHSSQFSRQYQQFWANPTNVPPLWISIMFSIFHISFNALTPNVAVGNDSNESLNKFSSAAAQCLAIGRYYKPQMFAVESLLLFAQSRIIVDPDVTNEVGILFGTLIRLAARSGYHRDPENLRLSVFEGEMRRRTWSLCMQLDLLVSFQLGVPTSIQFPTWDTRPPSNLLDSDFNEDSIVLPPGRPDSENTGMSFYVAKHRIMAVFEKIVRHTLSTQETSPTDLNSLDAELRGIYWSLPDNLKPRPMSESVVDSSSLIVTRLCVHFIYQKCLCVLHRKSAAAGYESSVRICYEASSSIMWYCLDGFKEFQPGGQYENERWFNSGITWHDYLIGATSLCLVQCVSSQGDFAHSVDTSKVLDLLRAFRTECARQATRGGDTMRVLRVIDATISRFGSDRGALIQEDLPYTVYTEGPGPGSFSGPSSSLDQGVAVPEELTFTAGFEDIAMPIDDISWTYLEQFLNLPNE